MKNVYDNGYKLIGVKKEIEKTTKSTLESMKKANDEYVIETCEEILDIIKDYDDGTIIMIDYSNGMGFTWETWEQEDIIKEKEV